MQNLTRIFSSKNDQVIQTGGMYFTRLQAISRHFTTRKKDSSIFQNSAISNIAILPSVKNKISPANIPPVCINDAVTSHLASWFVTLQQRTSLAIAPASLPQLQPLSQPLPQQLPLPLPQLPETATICYSTSLSYNYNTKRPISPIIFPLRSKTRKMHKKNLQDLQRGMSRSLP